MQHSNKRIRLRKKRRKSGAFPYSQRERSWRIFLKPSHKSMKDIHPRRGPKEKD